MEENVRFQKKTVNAYEGLRFFTYCVVFTQCVIRMILVLEPPSEAKYAQEEKFCVSTSSI